MGRPRKIRPEESDGKTILVEIVRAYWPDEDDRVNEGEQIEVSLESALELIEKGIVKRADPLTAV